ncbi:hypothetical protein BKA67DRAFT_113182 [Truncatella angustata]|uniref:Clr5 domain-containing protein n=1 Tax=Truncatella angustata TaxID=152316 RepID=A0A9P8RGP6_9PEZI|nr:uncharacterized protein BKA67DRAFT_113182 [Truncatella angustata]KAH6645464.1 hypothetical protein BKA67DRAFT_113182 [Truncatella angustata]
MIDLHSDQWATPEDFDRWRDLIVKLYMEDNRGLKEVKDMMANEHGFHATMKMYKYRLAKWNIHKYKKQGKDSKMGTKASSTSAQKGRPPRLIVVRPFEYEKPTRPSSIVARPLGLRGRPGNIVAKRQMQTPSSQRLSTPEVLRLPEEVIQLSFRLGTGLIDLGLWNSRTEMENPESNKWWGRMILSSQFFDLKKYKQAFETLNTEFDRFASLLEHPDPGLLQGAYLAVLQLDPQVARRFLEFAAEMAAIKLPALHPLRILLSRLNQTDMQELRHYAHQILESYLAALETKLGPSNSGVLVLYENLYDTLDFLSHEKGLHFVDPGAIHQRQLFQIQKLEALGLIPEAQSARIALAFAFWRHGSWEDAEQINDGVLEWLQTHPKEQHSKKLDLWDSLYLRFRCKTKIGTMEDVTRVGREYIDTLERDVGPHNKRVIAAIGHLQEYYKDSGYLKEAEELESAMEEPPETV